MENQLKLVKDMLGITGAFQDNTLKAYIDEVKEYMLNAGVAKEKIDDDKASGIIARGVIDLWNYGNGKAELSEYFYQRLTQLIYAGGNQPQEPATVVIPITKQEIDDLIEEDF